MKLELKHIAPYLPYGLNLIYNQIGDSKISKMTISNLETVIDMVNRNVENKAMFPILRPLSDLTKEIEVNGEKFVPIIELAKLFHISKSAVTHFSNIRNAGFYGISVNCHIENDDGRFMYYQIRNEEFVLSNTYEEVQKLFEWHFDVFGLIEQGLAIDINTL